MFPWGDQRRFNSYSRYFRELTGTRVQKLSVNAGFSCPNRCADGSGGCTFCSNDAFTPSYCTPAKSITQQIDEGVEFHANRYRKAEKYLAYFQSFSNTFAPLSRLREVYDEALAHPAVTGIVVGTRPDCIDGEKLDYFARLAEDRYVAIEYGVESTCDATLRAVNRGHDFECARRAIEMTASRRSGGSGSAGSPTSAPRGLHTGAHFILGLPSETDEMLVAQTAAINALPLDTVKFHQLQIFQGTPMAAEYATDPTRFRFWPTPAEYIDLFIEILRRLRPTLVVERFAGEAPPRHQAGPTWGLVRNEQLLNMLERRLEELDAWQGELFELAPQALSPKPRPAEG